MASHLIQTVSARWAMAELDLLLHAKRNQNSLKKFDAVNRNAQLQLDSGAARARARAGSSAHNILLVYHSASGLVGPYRKT